MFLGRVEPRGGADARAANTRPVASGDEQEQAARPVRVRRASSSRSRVRRPAVASSSARLVPSGRSLLVAFAVLGGVLASVVLARETSMFAVRTIEVEGAHGAVARQVVRALDGSPGESLLALDLESARVRGRARCRPSQSVTFDRAFPHTLAGHGRARAPGRRRPSGRRCVRRLARGRVIAPVERQSGPSWRGSGSRKDVRLDPGGFVEGDLESAVGAVAPLAGHQLPEPRRRRSRRRTGSRSGSGRASSCGSGDTRRRRSQARGRQSR